MTIANELFVRSNKRPSGAILPSQPGSVEVASLLGEP
jgi:hypothetical protein